jgi:hypothetical protein
MPKSIALATKHGKLSQIGPWIEALDGWTVELAEIDTDQFGTFSGDIGFGKVGFEYGLPCSDCDQVVQSVANAERHACVSCEHTELRTLGKTTVDPSRCDFCNP